jgi:hypothetical protein
MKKSNKKKKKKYKERENNKERIDSSPFIMIRVNALNLNALST